MGFLKASDPLHCLRSVFFLLIFVDKGHVLPKG